MTHRRQLIRKVEATHAVIGAALVIAAAVALAPTLWWSLGLGVLIGAGNFRALATIADRLAQPDPVMRRGAGALVALKLAALVAAIGLSMWLLHPDAVALVVGLSLAPFSLLAVVAIAPGRRPQGPGQPTKEVT